MPALSILKVTKTSYEINVANFYKVLDKVLDYPVAIFSINGCMREGKSYMWNILKCNLKKKGKRGWYMPILPDEDAFPWRRGAERETVGINIWSEPYITTTKKGKEVAVLLLDCQGLFDKNTTPQQNAAIFALSNLLSSVMTYNVKTKISEDLLQHIQFFSDYARALSRQDAGKGRDNLPNFIFLMRDFEFTSEYAYGFHSQDEYPEGDLGDAARNYFHHVFVNNSGAGSGVPDANRAMRAAIRERFKDLSMFLMPHPGKEFVKDPAKTPPDTDFQVAAQAYVKRTISNLKTKKIGGEEMTGKSLKPYVKQWAELCEQSKKHFPPATTMGEAAARMQNDIAVSTAFQTFRTKCKDTLNAHSTGLRDSEFRATLQPMLRKAVEVYRSNRSLGDEKLQAECVEKLTKLCEEHFEEVCVPHNTNLRRIKKQKLSKEETKEAVKEERQNYEQASTAPGAPGFFESVGKVFDVVLGKFIDVLNTPLRLPRLPLPEYHESWSDGGGLGGCSRPLPGTIPSSSSPRSRDRLLIDAIRSLPGRTPPTFGTFSPSKPGFF